MPDDLIERLIALADRDAGHDVNLSHDEERAIRLLVWADPDCASLYGEVLEANQGFDQYLASLDGLHHVSVPEKLITLIRNFCPRNDNLGQDGSSASAV